jgi:hypothetical protein
MLDGAMVFGDGQRSGFRGFGTGRTFPVRIGDRAQLRLGAVVDILQGFGRLQGLSGTVTVNGYITPPFELALNFIIRLSDPGGRLQASSPLDSPRRGSAPDDDSTFFAVIGEDDPSQPTQTGGVGGHVVVHEVLRAVDIGFDAHRAGGMRARANIGRVVGSLETRLHFDPRDPRPVVPFRTSGSVFTFRDADARVVGCLSADLVEGRAFRLPGPEGTALPVFRMAGFGPILPGGSGQFADAVGMVSLNAAVSVFPSALSNCYVIRLWHPRRETCVSSRSEAR